MILHCGNKLPEAFEFLKDKIKGVVKKNHGYIAHYIINYHKEELIYIFDYPEELLSLLNWNLPEDKIYYNDDRAVKEMLSKFQQKNPAITKNRKYIKLLEKLPTELAQDLY